MIDLTRSSRGQQHATGAGNREGAILAEKTRPDAAAVLDDEIDNARVIVCGDPRQAGRTRPEDASDLASVASCAWSTRRACAPLPWPAPARRRARGRTARPTPSNADEPGPSSTRTWTARGSHSPSPAAIVSPRAPGVSPGTTAAAMPPCAGGRVAFIRLGLVRMSTSPCPATSGAARSGNALPITRKSERSSKPLLMLLSYHSQTMSPPDQRRRSRSSRGSHSTGRTRSRSRRDRPTASCGAGRHRTSGAPLIVSNQTVWRFHGEHMQGVTATTDPDPRRERHSTLATVDGSTMRSSARARTARAPSSRGGVASETWRFAAARISAGPRRHVPTTLLPRSTARSEARSA